MVVVVVVVVLEVVVAVVSVTVVLVVVLVVVTVVVEVFVVVVVVHWTFFGRKHTSLVIFGRSHTKKSFELHEASFHVPGTKESDPPIITQSSPPPLSFGSFARHKHSYGAPFASLHSRLSAVAEDLSRGLHTLSLPT